MFSPELPYLLFILYPQTRHTDFRTYQVHVHVHYVSNLLYQPSTNARIHTSASSRGCANQTNTSVWLSKVLLEITLDHLQDWALSPHIPSTGRSYFCILWSQYQMFSSCAAHAVAFLIISPCITEKHITLIFKRVCTTITSIPLL